MYIVYTVYCSLSFLCGYDNMDFITKKKLERGWVEKNILLKASYASNKWDARSEERRGKECRG